MLHNVRACGTSVASKAHAPALVDPSPFTAPLPPSQVEDLDLALRKKDKATALAKLPAAQTSLDKVLSKVL